MNIQDIVVEQNKAFTKTFAIGRFPSPKVPKKMKRAFFEEEIITSVASSQLILIEQILKKNELNEYETADDILADLHLIAVDVMNNFKLKATSQKCAPYSVENFLPGGSLLTGKGL